MTSLKAHHLETLRRCFAELVRGLDAADSAVESPQPVAALSSPDPARNEIAKAPDAAATPAAIVAPKASVAVAEAEPTATSATSHSTKPSAKIYFAALPWKGSGARPSRVAGSPAESAQPIADSRPKTQTPQDISVPAAGGEPAPANEGNILVAGALQAMQTAQAAQQANAAQRTGCKAYFSALPWQGATGDV